MNGAPRDRMEFVRDKLYTESGSILTEVVSRDDRCDEVPRTWIMTMRDRAVSVKAQRRNMEALGGVQKLIELDTCHNLMVSEPERLAQILVERCRAWC